MQGVAKKQNPQTSVIMMNEYRYVVVGYNGGQI